MIDGTDQIVDRALLGPIVVHVEGIELGLEACRWQVSIVTVAIMVHGQEGGGHQSSEITQLVGLLHDQRVPLWMHETVGEDVIEGIGELEDAFQSGATKKIFFLFFFLRAFVFVFVAGDEDG